MASVIRLSILGTMPGGEVWSVNPTWFLLDEPTEVTGTEAQTIATAANAVVVPTGLRAILNTSSFFTGVRVEARHRDGTLEAQGEAVKAVPLAGTGAGNHPYQTSSVTSLRTATAGAKGRGRLYWPATGSGTTASTLRMDATTQTSLLSAVKTYLNLLTPTIAASAGPAELSVWSRTTNGFSKVINLRQGDIFDTQRRRRDALAEGYQDLVFP